VVDAGQPGLYLQARRRRVRFVFEYLPPAGGRRRRMQIDDYGAITPEAARSAPLEHRMQVAHGIDPQDVREEKRRLGMTVADLAAGNLDDLAQRARTRARRGKPGGYDTAKRLLELHVLPALGRVTRGESGRRGSTPSMSTAPPSTPALGRAALLPKKRRHRRQECRHSFAAPRLQAVRRHVVADDLCRNSDRLTLFV
jgi:hypothetical protein